MRHRRARHATYAFSHHVWYLALYLDELDDIERWPLLGYERRALLEVRDEDHLGETGTGLRDAVTHHLERTGLEPDSLRITLITCPRVLGYVFNPVSFYLCHDLGGRLRHVIAEVSNTHGGRATYDFAPEGERGFHSSATKRMYVSPFIDAEARYDLSVVESADRLAISISEYGQDELTLFASVDLGPRQFTTPNLLGALARDPLVPLKTIILIGWHAARLWWRGVHWRRYAGS